MSRIKKAFTLTELIIVVAIIWILMMWVTVYIWWLWERAKTIEAQWCAASLWWQINNYVFNALTSKNLRLDNGTIISPDIYQIVLAGGTKTPSKNCSRINYANEWIYCNELNFNALWWDVRYWYRTYNVRNTCRQNQANIWFFWSGLTTSDINNIRMNKWFAPRSISERKVFYLNQIDPNLSEEENKLTEGDIIVVLCPNNECANWKEVAKYHVDARVQSISFHKCRFYQEDGITCDARED